MDQQHMFVQRDRIAGQVTSRRERLMGRAQPQQLRVQRKRGAVHAMLAFAPVQPAGLEG
jgi:hypothetical protein